VHTFSIVARDAKTGEMGVAVQSHWFSVGSVVTWGEAGVGVVATQSIIDPGYGPKGLDLMRRGVAAPAALAPEIQELPFWQAITLVSVGREAQAVPILKAVLAKEPWWADLIPRLPAANQLPNDAALIKRLMALKPR
jgi:hypothetical protein